MDFYFPLWTSEEWGFGATLSRDGSTYQGSLCRSLSNKVQSNPILLFWVNYSDVSILEELTTPGTFGTFIFLLY